MSNYVNVAASTLHPFNNNAELHAHLVAINGAAYSKHSDSWCGGSYDTAMHKLLVGDAALAEKAQQIVDQLSDIELFSAGNYTIEAHYYGHKPNIGAVIAGQPKSMRRRVATYETSIAAPLTIYVSSVISANFTTTQITNRGLACVAFALAMKKVRPVTLIVGAEADPQYSGVRTVTTVNIDLQSIDLATAAFMLISPMFFRRLMVAEAHYRRKSPIMGSYGMPIENTKILAALIKAENETVIIGGARSSNSDSELILNEPVKWVRKRLEQYKAPH